MPVPDCHGRGAACGPGSSGSGILATRARAIRALPAPARRHCGRRSGREASPPPRKESIMHDGIILGAVAYDPKVVTIWEGFQRWFRGRGLDFDYVLYSNYERQVEALLAGHFDVAWNSPLAWLEAERAARGAGRRADAIAMRDSDRDLRSVIVVCEESPIHGVDDLRGKTVAVGAGDSPQATLIPLVHLAEHGL